MEDDHKQIESLKQQLSDLQQRYDTVYNVVQEWKNAHYHYQQSMAEYDDLGYEPLNPIERLRFLCSIAFAGDTWLFSEKLFVDIIEMMISTPLSADQINADNAHNQLFWRNTPSGIEHKIQWELVRILCTPDDSFVEVGVLNGVRSPVTNTSNLYVPLIPPKTEYHDYEKS